MTQIFRAAAVLAAMGLAACSTSADRFGGGGGGAGGMGPDGMAPMGGFGAAGSVDDPASAAYFNQRVGDRVLFVVDTSTLTEEARQILSGQARFLTANPSYSAIVEGHADERGTQEYNLALGARRAASVRDFLVSQGVSPNRLRTITYGKERPLEICSVEACYAQNRRAVTVLGAASGLSS